MLDTLFQLSKRNASFKQELLAGLTTFFTLAYIAVVASQLLAMAGMDVQQAFVAVCVASGIGSILSGLLGGYPIALAPGLGLLSYFVFVIVQEGHHDFRAALAMVFASGALFLLVTISRLRFLVLRSIPASLGAAISCGIGFFIALIALKNSGFVVNHASTGIALGQLGSPNVLLLILGFLMVVVLDFYKIPGALLIALLSVFALAVVFGVSQVGSFFSWPSSFLHHPVHLQWSVLLQSSTWPLVFTLFMVALFDSTGTLIGLTRHLDPANASRRIQKTFLAESLSIMGAATLGSSSVTAMVENAAGIRAGGKTGLTAVVAGICFLLLVFAAPLASWIPSCATSAVLLYVACLMAKNLSQLDWETPTESIPATLTLLTIPFTYSIANGVGFGVMSYVAVNLLCGKRHQISWVLYGLALLFLIYFWI